MDPIGKVAPAIGRLVSIFCLQKTAGRPRLFATGVRVFALFELHADWNSGKVELLAKIVDQIADIGLRQLLGKVSEEKKGRRPRFNLCGVAQFQASPFD